MFPVTAFKRVLSTRSLDTVVWGRYRVITILISKLSDFSKGEMFREKCPYCYYQAQF